MATPAQTPAAAVIAKITKGRNIAGLARYLYGPGRHEQHVNPRLVAGANVMLDHRTESWRPWVEDMQWSASQNPRVKRPVWHCSLRLAPGDRHLTDQEWGDIAREHVEALGLTDHPWVAVRHADNHIHIVACRVDHTGRVWSDRFDYAPAMASARAIEAHHDLWTPNHPAGRLATTTRGERASAARRDVDPERAQLRDAMHAARRAAAGRGSAGWEHELDARGVLHRAARNRAGRISGYSVSLPGWLDAAGTQVWLRASQVDRQLSWNRLHGPLDIEHEERMAAVRASFPHTARDASRRQPTSTKKARPTLPPKDRERGPDRDL